jgi:hypothetical protein
MKLPELTDALRAWKCSHTFPFIITSLCLATRSKLLYLLILYINVIESGTTKPTFAKYELTGNTFHITFQVMCSVSESGTGFSEEGATQC